MEVNSRGVKCFLLRALATSDRDQARRTANGEKPLLFRPALALTLLGVGMRAVPDYRAFVIGPDDHVIDRHDLTANDDEAAKKRV